jgi:hypothetical protein
VTVVTVRRTGATVRESTVRRALATIRARRGCHCIVILPMGRQSLLTRVPRRSARLDR